MNDDPVLVQPEGAEELASISNLISEHIDKLDHASSQAKKYNQMLNDLLDGSESYREQSKVAKEAAAEKGKVKKQILNTPQAKDIDGKIKDLRLSIKEANEALSDYLTQYQKITGSGEFEDSSGNLRKIVYVAKLLKS